MTVQGYKYSSSTGDRSSGMSFPRREYYIHQNGSGLHSVQGAQAIISSIVSRPVVKKLMLGRNELADAGCIALFQFLSSDIGQRNEIDYICLNSNQIGDSGLAAIAAYLHGNNNLKELFLQNNEFTGDSTNARTFANAVSASHLEILSLTSNRLSDTFVEAFLPALTSNHLREFNLSTTNITHKSMPAIKDYISSKRCKLSAFQCNANFLGLHAVLSIIRAVEQYNYSLTSLELYEYSNGFTDVNATDDALDKVLRARNIDAWKECRLSIQQILARNEQLGRETRHQALRLLRCARTVLLRTRGNAAGFGQTSIPTSLQEAYARSDAGARLGSTSSFSFQDLPPEIQHHILSFLSPILSPRQRLTIYNYAATPVTLPALLPRLVGSTTDWKESIVERKAVTAYGRTSARYTAPQYNPVCTRKREKFLWLVAVECTMYEPTG